MRFKIGDEVKVTKAFLLNLPSLAHHVKDGGVVTDIHTREARVRFYSGYVYHIFLSSLELKFIKNQQLLFEFMG